MSKVEFSDLGLADSILRALKERDHSTPTPIQAQAIPIVLSGRDILGIAQTGTGKTAAFALPLLQRLSGKHSGTRKGCPRALVLAPTRELALQIGEQCRAYGKHLRLRQTVIFGGVSQHPQVKALDRGLDIVIATPGRLLDLMKQGHLSLQAVQTLIVDEADRMLDMGFVRDVRKIVAALPKERQSLFFSATMAGEVARLSREILSEPARVEITPQATPVERIEQLVCHVSGPDKRALLARYLADPAWQRVIVFARTKHGANRIAEQLEKAGVSSAAIHGNKSQNVRQRALKSFRSGEVRVLVATDIAARGIDVDGITHVVNYELPNEPESYVHRIGRTARAGAAGIAVSFCAPGERAYLRDIERLIKRSLTVMEEGAAEIRIEAPGTEDKAPARRKPAGRNRNRNRGPKGAANTNAAQARSGQKPPRKNRRPAGSKPAAVRSAGADGHKGRRSRPAKDNGGNKPITRRVAA